MNNKQAKVLEQISTDPILASIVWADILSLMKALGAEIKQSSGSRVGFSLNSVDIVVHRPHPQKETDKGTVKSIRKFLTNAEVIK